MVAEISKLTSKRTPRKEEMVKKGNPQKILEVSALGENERHTR